MPPPAYKSIFKTIRSRGGLVIADEGADALGPDRSTCGASCTMRLYLTSDCWEAVRERSSHGCGHLFSEIQGLGLLNLGGTRSLMCHRFACAGGYQEMRS